MPIFNEVMRRYLITAIGYNVIYKTFELWDAKVKRSSGKTTDILLGEKINIVLFTTLLAPTTFPSRLTNHLDKIDIFMKKHNPEDYDIEKNPKRISYYYLS